MKINIGEEINEIESRKRGKIKKIEVISLGNSIKPARL